MIRSQTTSPPFYWAVLLVAVLLLPSCRATSNVATEAGGPDDATADTASPGTPAARTVQPGAPGTASRVLTREALAADPHLPYTEADVRFMQGMIAHHAQALEMTALVPSRTDREGLHLLARRIEVTQASEIRLMQDWLRARGEDVPEGHAHHGHTAGGTHPMRMPGMLTEEQMSRLADATGAAFEALFLEYMISHHEGALVMVADLFSTPGAGQDTDIYRFASDVDVDQRMEIRRMQALLDARR